MAISPATSYRRGQELHHDRRHAQLPAPQLYEEVESRIELQYTDARGTYVRGLTQVEVRSEQEALDQLFNEVARRGRVTLSKLHLLDLAGSERLKKTTIKKESIDINQCLSFLKQCIVALGSKKQRHTPYRQMKLTNVLKDSLGGNSNTLMFACIWGECRHLEETISTLKLAQRMMRVQNEVGGGHDRGNRPGAVATQVTRRVNAAKAQIDAVRARTGAKQVPQERDEVVDEEEFMLMAAETRLSIAFRRPSRSWNFHFAAWSFYDDDLCVSLKTGMTKRVTPTLLAKRQVLLGLTPSRDQRSAKMLDDGEKFDQMEVDRVRAKDPASLAFSQAQKKMRQQQAGAIVPASERKAKLDSLLTIQRRTRNQRWFDCV
ncbi:hypothetical protein PF002_g28280 [Phytophthora fragariae]|uniref:Kinesin motor domain-containing protein n=1 Tax=Phytophthora fragariae TaxID=53985 RepID=A0A6A3W5K9_9STRA|nr:hypothetical protein PF002_g28280 [Phytophthora fragariae]